MVSVQNRFARSWSSTSSATLPMPLIMGSTSTLRTSRPAGCIHFGYTMPGYYTQAVTTTEPAPPLTLAAFQVLLALSAGKAHGYAVMQFVEQLTAGSVRLRPGA